MTLKLSPEERIERRRKQLREAQRRYMENPDNKQNYYEKYILNNEIYKEKYKEKYKEIYKEKYKGRYEGRYEGRYDNKIELKRFIKYLMRIDVS